MGVATPGAFDRSRFAAGNQVSNYFQRAPQERRSFVLHVADDSRRTQAGSTRSGGGPSGRLQRERCRVLETGGEADSARGGQQYCAKRAGRREGTLASVGRSQPDAGVQFGNATFVTADFGLC